MFKVTALVGRIGIKIMAHTHAHDQFHWDPIYTNMGPYSQSICTTYGILNYYGLRHSGTIVYGTIDTL